MGWCHQNQLATKTNIDEKLSQQWQHNGPKKLVLGGSKEQGTSARHERIRSFYRRRLRVRMRWLFLLPTTRWAFTPRARPTHTPFVPLLELPEPPDAHLFTGCQLMAPSALGGHRKLDRSCYCKETQTKKQNQREGSSDEAHHGRRGENFPKFFLTSPPTGFLLHSIIVQCSDLSKPIY